MFGLSTLRVISCASLLVLAACASKPAADRTDTWSPNKIYAEGKDEAKAGAWDKAIPLFEKLEGRAAGTPLAQQAQLEKAFAHYKANEPAQALATIDRFKKLHPASAGMDYALYLQGLINFNDNLGIFGFLAKQDLSERDQNAAKESFEAFKELVTRFPDSKYAPDSRARMTYIVNSLAQYEVHVARYYYTRNAYVAAINRAQTAVTDYQNVPASEEALYIIMLSYDALNMPQLRDDTKRVLEKNFPKSEFLARGFKSKDSPWWKLW
ncbi:outer membrane protein assembly factor BamD [Variovorax sp. PCZ-1]|uniref:outer membrane protein assembly factor BamD n=1 Tax=Variovorax sp. PCZ-1 TaxID=2835533 RepID=UPI001BCA6C5C|nr:outer membrane protein assembly factor BamD [Variovorax sp. PCZ-1]MBS7807932.1 outer membrane protein assembly factor BamD [Variovorax sp. PCZ-1]